MKTKLFYIMAQIKTGYASIENLEGIEYCFIVDFYNDSDDEIHEIYLDSEFHKSIVEPLNDVWFIENNFIEKRQLKNIHKKIYVQLFKQAKEWSEENQIDIKEN